MNSAAAFQLKPTWIGGDHVAARVQAQRAREAGMSALQALALGNVASFDDGWVFRKTIAQHLGCSIKTVQRGLNRGKAEGLLGIARAKKGEIPKGRKHPLNCGWSHRWMIARDMVGNAARAAIAWARAQAIARKQRAVARELERRTLQRRDQKRRELTEDDRRELERIDAESRARELPD